MNKLIKLGLVVLIASVSTLTNAQKFYNPEANAEQDIELALERAKQEGKHVLIQVGGNWCPWCIKLHKYLDNEKEINELLNENYIFLEVNYSKENKNLNTMKRLEYPQRFGFPVLVVLNEKGERIHTQNTGILEENKGYDFKKVKSFLYNWRPDALNPNHYK